MLGAEGVSNECVRLRLEKKRASLAVVTAGADDLPGVVDGGGDLQCPAVVAHPGVQATVLVRPFPSLRIDAVGFPLPGTTQPHPHTFAGTTLQIPTPNDHRGVETWDVSIDVLPNLISP